MPVSEHFSSPPAELASTGLAFYDTDDGILNVFEGYDDAQDFELLQQTIRYVSSETLQLRP